MIIDLSGVGHLDVSGCKALNEIQLILHKLEMKLLLAFPNHRIYNALLDSSLLENGTFQIFPTIHDAVLFSVAKMNE